MSRRKLLCHKCMKKFSTHSSIRTLCYACSPAEHAGMRVKYTCNKQQADTIGKMVHL